MPDSRQSVRRIAAVAVLLALVVSLTWSTSASGTPQVGPEDAVPDVAEGRGRSNDRSSGPSSAASVLQLRDEAARNGTVRVVVSLDQELLPEGTLDAPARGRQRAAAVDGTEAFVERVQQAALSSADVRVTRRYETVPAVAVEVTSAGLDALAADPSVAAVTADIVGELTVESTMPIVGADQAWAAGYDGTGQTIAVVDSGVQSDHPFFGGRVSASQACFSVLGSCPNGQVQQFGAGAAEPCDFAADCGHGTHVAGIAAGDLSSTFRGVAPDAQIVAVSVASDNGGGNVAVFASDELAALDWLLVNRKTLGLTAINLSISGGNFAFHCDAVLPAMAQVIDSLRSYGIASVMATGNDGFVDGIGFPACNSGAVAVSATNDADQIPSYANAAGIVDAMAPGDNVISSVPTSTYAPNSGTSMASPHVAGAVALLADKDAQKSAVDQNRVAAILKALSTTGTCRIDITGLAYPRINVKDALDAYAGGFPDPGFSDVSPSHPFYTEISWLVFAEIANGFGDGTFRSGNDITRQAVIAFLHRLAGAPAGPYPDPGFSDVSPGDPFYTEISWAKAVGLTNGFGDGTFRPGNPITRQAVVAFLYRMVGEPGGPYVDPAFSDVSSTHPFLNEISWARAAGVTEGYSNGTFRPGNPITRQAVGAMVYRESPCLSI